MKLFNKGKSLILFLLLYNWTVHNYTAKYLALSLELSSSLCVFYSRCFASKPIGMLSTVNQVCIFQVHERQTERMRTRSEWFLTPTAAAQFECAYGGCIDSDPTLHVLRGANTRSSSSNIGAGLSASAESVQKRPSIRRTNSRSEKTRHLVHRNSSRRNKENGQRGTSDRADRVERASGSGDCTPPSEQINLPSNVTLTYKPRI